MTRQTLGTVNVYSTSIYLNFLKVHLILGFIYGFCLYIGENQSDMDYITLSYFIVSS